MIESIEGKRGMPRLRPPYVAQVGPVRPADARAQHGNALLGARHPGEGRRLVRRPGTPRPQGLRSFSVSGRVKKPGVHLAPAGITVRELIDEYCGGMLDGHAFYGYLPGGASGGILPASMGDIPLDFDTLQPHGCFIGSAAVIVLSQRDRARDAAVNLMQFFADESCGQCTPCRVGTAKAVALMEQPQWDTPLLAELSQAMADASICGLGPGGAEPDQLRRQVFSARARVDLSTMNAPHEHGLTQQAITLPAERRGRRSAARRDDHRGRATALACRSRACATRPACGPTATAARAWSRSRASACWRRRAAARRRSGMDVQTGSARAVHAQKMIVELLASDVPDRVYKPDSELAQWKAQARHRHAALRRARSSPRPTCRIRRWRSTSTPASSARAACARAARSR